MRRGMQFGPEEIIRNFVSRIKLFDRRRLSDPLQR